MRKKRLTLNTWPHIYIKKPVDRAKILNNHNNKKLITY